MKVYELIDFINRKISEGKIRRDSEVLCSNDELGGLYEYNPSRFNLVCLKGDKNAEFFIEDIHHKADYYNRLFSKHENDAKRDYYSIEYEKAKEAERKLNAEWHDALVI